MTEYTLSLRYTWYIGLHCECVLITQTTCSCSTCVGPSMRSWQWIKCQCTHATSGIGHLRGNCVIHWIQPGDSWLMSWSSHNNRTHQAVGLTSSVCTRGGDGGGYHGRRRRSGGCCSGIGRCFVVGGLRTRYTHWQMMVHLEDGAYHNVWGLRGRLFTSLHVNFGEHNIYWVFYTCTSKTMCTC